MYLVIHASGVFDLHGMLCAMVTAFCSRPSHVFNESIDSVVNVIRLVVSFFAEAFQEPFFCRVDVMSPFSGRAVFFC